MKCTLTSILFLLFALPYSGFAQTATEAQRLSTSDPLGTARNLGTGNSMFAIGADMSVIGSNPAGIGAFWKSEFSITAGGVFNSYSASFSTDRGSTINGNFNHVSIPNIGFIISSRPWNSSWKTSNWAIGMNRVANYKNEIQYEGNPLGSITDSWRELAQGVSPQNLNGFEEGLAYEAGAIYDFDEDNTYETDYLLNPQYGLYKREDATMVGGKTEIYLGYGANLNDKFLFGFSVNLPLVNYSEYRTYREIDEAGDGVPFFNDLEYNRTINTTGYGINGKAGVTFKPTRQMMISLAIHTPTKLQLTDNFNTTITYDYTDENHDGPIRAESPFGSFEYGLRTPWSLVGGIGLIAGKAGFVSASAKWTDYASMKYDYNIRGNGNAYEQIERKVNNDIRINYGSAINLNLGGELVLDALRLRGGVSLAQSAYSNDDGFDPSFHAGIGYRADNYFVDLGYRLTQIEDGYLPYETTSVRQPLVIHDVTKHHISATLGLKF